MLLYLLYGFIFLIVAAAAVEIYCRRQWQRTALCEDIYADPHWRKPFPYIMFKGEPGYQHLNELGYPGPAPQMPKEENEYRVVILGGSTVFNGEPSIGGLLEQMCHRNGMGNVRVYNSGVVSSSSGMELARMLFEFSDRDVDLVIFYNGGNDLLGPHYNDPRPGYPPNYVVHEANPILERDVSKYPLMTLVLYSSIFLRYWVAPFFKKRFIKLDALRAEAGLRTKQWQNAIVDSYVGNIIKAGKTIAGFNARFIAFFQPILFFKDPGCISPEERKHINMDEQPYWQGFRYNVIKALAQATDKAGVRAVDLSGIFSSNPNWIYTDAIHIRQEMQEVVASGIFKELQRANLLKAQTVSHYL
jgi:hypothetical protein